MLRALLLTKQAQFSVGPAQALRMIDFSQPHKYIIDGNPGNCSSGANQLTMLRQFAASFARNDVGCHKRCRTAGQRHRKDAFAGAGFDTTTAATAGRQEVRFVQGAGRSEWIGVDRAGEQGTDRPGGSQGCSRPQDLATGKTTAGGGFSLPSTGAVVKRKIADRAYLTASPAEKTVGGGCRQAGIGGPGGADLFAGATMNARCRRFGGKVTPFGEPGQNQAGGAQIHTPETRENNQPQQKDAGEQPGDLLQP